MVKSLLSTGLMLAAAAPVGAQEMAAPMSSRMDHGNYSAAGTNALGMPSAQAHALARFRTALRDLRRRALAMREADGGTLTPEHLAFIQARLDAAQVAYRHYENAP